MTYFKGILGLLISLPPLLCHFSSGFVAEKENRHWLAFESELQYIAASCFRFMQEDVEQDALNSYYQRVMLGEPIELLSDRG